MCIDGRDHVYVVNRQNVVDADLNGASLAPPVIEFDADGRVVRAWGDPDLLGDRLHDCHVDANQNVWIVASGTGYVQKYSRDGGELRLQIGNTGVYDSSDGTRDGRPLNSNRARFFLPASLDVDAATGDIYVADGELPRGNQRIAVLDRNGRFLRQWPLHRTEAERDIAQLPHCLRVSDDGFVYVCDRQADRIQVFDRMGTFIRNIDVPWPAIPVEARRGPTRGTAVVVAFSPDPEQRLMFVVNQNSVMVDVLDRRSGELLSSFGGGPGRYPGQFTAATRHRCRLGGQRLRGGAGRTAYPEVQACHAVAVREHMTIPEISEQHRPRPGARVRLKRFSDSPCTAWARRGTSACTNAGGPMQAYSMDLRERALLDSDAGMKAADVAVKYRVSGSWVRLLKQRRRETGEVAPRVQRHGRRRMLEPHLHTLAALIAEQPDRTLAELKDALGTPASLATIWRAVAALDVTVKKNGPALRTRST